MLIKIIKSLLITILLFVGIFILAMCVEILKNMIGVTTLMVVLFSTLVFSIVFGLVLITIFWWRN